MSALPPKSGHGWAIYAYTPQFGTSSIAGLAPLAAQLRLASVGRHEVDVSRELDDRRDIVAVEFAELVDRHRHRLDAERRQSLLHRRHRALSEFQRAADRRWRRRSTRRVHGEQALASPIAISILPLRGSCKSGPMHQLSVRTHCSTPVSCNSPRWRYIIGCPRFISIARLPKSDGMLSYGANDASRVLSMGKLANRP